jgi:(2Fe-2S) ferredoxin
LWKLCPGGHCFSLDGEDRHLPAFERHVFVCHNARPEGAPRPSCTSNGTSDLHARLQQLVKAAGLGGKVRINKSGCLDQCEHGPTVVVYPEAVWYGNVRPEDAAAGGRRVPEHEELPAPGMRAGVVGQFEKSYPSGAKARMILLG